MKAAVATCRDAQLDAHVRQQVAPQTVGRRRGDAIVDRADGQLPLAVVAFDQARAARLVQLLVEHDRRALRVLAGVVEQRPVGVRGLQEHAGLLDQRPFQAVLEDQPIGAVFGEVKLRHS